MIAMLRRILSALPDALTALVFLAAWIAPLGWGQDLVSNLMLVMLLEFLVVHSSAFIGMTVLSGSVSRAKKTVTILGFGAFYMLFVLAFSLAFHRSWAIAAFSWLLVGKLVAVWFSPLPREKEADRQRSLWGLSVVAYIGGVFATTLLPLPRLGLQPEVVAQLGLPGKGLWVEKPHTVIVFGLLYFGALAWAKWRDPLTLLSAKPAAPPPP